ncbi:MAG: TolC family protein [Deltaproteobacteria bacterium]|nr:TolC family protein [Deltaproteobacteria bacterium]
MRHSIFIRRSVCGLLGILLALCLNSANAQTQNGMAYPIDIQTTLRLAGAQNLDIRIARSQLQRSRANQLMAWEKFLPWLTSGAVFDRRDGMSIASLTGQIAEAHYGFNLPGLVVSGQVPVGDAIFNALSARQLVRAAAGSLDAQFQNSSLEAALSYFQTLEDKARANVERQAAIISATYQKELHHAVEVGIAFRGDELRVKTETERYQIAIQLWLQRQRDSSAKLADILRMDSSIELIPEDSDLVPIMLFDVQTPLQAIIQQSYISRPEIRQSQAMIEAANAQRKAVTYGPIIPTLSTTMFFGSLNGGPDNDLKDNNGAKIRRTQGTPVSGRNSGPTQDILFGVNWKIGPGGLGDLGAIRAATAKLDTEQLRGQKVIDEITRQVVQSFTRIRSYYNQISMARNNVKSARETLRLTEGRKDYGVGNVLEVIQAEQALERASTEYVVALAEFNKSQYELSRAVGGMLPGNMR